MPDGGRVLHCWKCYREWIEETYGYLSDRYIESYDEPSATCVLPAGHAGPHVWTDDGDIGVSFKAEREEPKP